MDPHHDDFAQDIDREDPQDALIEDPQDDLFDAPELDEVMVITGEVFFSIVHKIGLQVPERGGALGGPGHDRRGELTHFEYDFSSQRTGVTYSPDIGRLNRIFKTRWNPADIYLRGFVHSHPGSHGRPSGGDLEYAAAILDAIPELGQLYLPIVGSTAHSAAFELRPFTVISNEDRLAIHPIPLLITAPDLQEHRRLPANLELDEDIYDQELDEVYIPARHKRWQGADLARGGQSQQAQATAAAAATAPRDIDPAEAFSRVEQAYDLELMQAARLVIVGAGGAAAFIDDMARTGIGQLVLIDPDTVDAPNLGTQQVYQDDLGQPKVDVLARRLRRINPRMIVESRQAALDDLDDDALYELACGELQGQFPEQTVLCGFTDSFHAQARVNRLALVLGLPSINAQVYKEGRGAEITFTHPQVTPACHRCVLRSRYDWYLEQGNENDVTSHATPIFATTRLNALKGPILLALLHHGSKHSRWGGLLTQMGHRNLVQIRLDPDIASTMQLGVFDKVFAGADRERLLFDEVVWLPQEPEDGAGEHPICPDCGGTGELWQKIGSIEDTRPMPGATGD